MTRSFVVTFDVQKAEKLAEKFGLLSADQIGRVTVPVLNQVTERTYDLARDRITSGINLSDDYLRKRMSVTPATGAKPSAAITALGDKSTLTPLSRYDAKMVLQPKRSSRTRGKGLLPLNGQRQAGVNVGVTRGTEKDISYAFMLPLRKGNVAGGNGLGVFTRPKDGGKYRHRYGPQVYQLFAYQAARIEDDVLDDMESSLTEAVVKATEDYLK
jgi:hypothetical protein